MICIKIHGGLGNQMFQFAAAYSLARLRSAEVRVYAPEATFPASEQIYRPFELNQVFGNAPFKMITQSEYNRMIGQGSSYFVKAVNRVKGVSYFHESDLRFDESLFDLPRNTVIEGYFQSYRYFDKRYHDLLQAFRFTKELSPESKKVAEAIRSRNSCAIHFRRGDYISNPVTQRIHGTCGLPYYRDAVESFADVDDLEFFLFSDEPDWVKENFRIDRPFHVVSHNAGVDAWQDMALMQKCNHFIISNSSFSWWAAILSTNPYKRVIRPERWFSDSEKQNQTSDMFPPSWMVR